MSAETSIRCLHIRYTFMFSILVYFAVIRLLAERNFIPVTSTYIMKNSLVALLLAFISSLGSFAQNNTQTANWHRHRQSFRTPARQCIGEYCGHPHRRLPPIHSGALYCRPFPWVGTTFLLPTSVTKQLPFPRCWSPPASRSCSMCRSTSRSLHSNAVTVTAGRTRKGMAANEFAGSSARSFSMDDVTRYAGGRNDPAKLASNFAGVANTNDSRNDIVVRGNAPTAVCGVWKAFRSQP